MVIVENNKIKIDWFHKKTLSYAGFYLFFPPPDMS